MAGRSKNRSGRAGFTLVEALVVLGLVALLASMLLVVLSKARSGARMIVCRSNLQQMNEAYAACVLDHSGALPDVYYVLGDTGEAFTAQMRTTPAQPVDPLFKYFTSELMRCPLDTQPVKVLGFGTDAQPAQVNTSYGYNVNLPLMYLNASRVSRPAGNVTFYDGNARAVVGSWGRTESWAEKTFVPRHGGNANYAYLDGHVESHMEFPNLDFAGGTEWLIFDVAASSGHSVAGEVDLSANPSTFSLTISSTYSIVSEDLNSPMLTDYYGPAQVLTITPKGSGTASIMVDGKPYILKKNTTYTISASSFVVNFYNSKRNKQGRATGQWHIAIVNAEDVQITES